jgi:hypothetical protein
MSSVFSRKITMSTFSGCFTGGGTPLYHRTGLRQTYRSSSRLDVTQRRGDDRSRGRVAPCHALQLSITEGHRFRLSRAGNQRERQRHDPDSHRCFLPLHRSRRSGASRHGAILRPADAIIQRPYTIIHLTHCSGLLRGTASAFGEHGPGGVCPMLPCPRGAGRDNEPDRERGAPIEGS